MTHTETIITLGKLMPCPDNVRRLHNEASVNEMAASIEHHGLIHNLVVRPAPKAGRFEVLAGGRRLTALRRLMKEGRAVLGTIVTKDFPVRVMVREDGGTELSLAENVQRVAMHPVDEITAYHALAEQGIEVENIAARFGQSPVTVRQRLKLASLSPRILDVLRADGMTMEQAKALAISDDHAAQERAWFEQPNWSHDPHSLRSFLTQEHARASDRLARFVGIDAYEAAGGIVLRDLFADSADTYLTNRPLLVELATQKLEAVAAELRSEGWGWTEIQLEYGGYSLGNCSRIFPTERERTPEEQTETDALEAEAEELEARYEDIEDDEERESAERRMGEVQARLDAIETACRVYDPQAMAMAGCKVGIGYDGTASILRGLVRAEHTEAHAVDGGEGPDDDSTPDTAKGGYSAALMEELTAIRTAALRVELAERPHIALAALLLPLVSRLYHGHGAIASYDSPIDVRGDFRDLSASIRDTEACDALSRWKGVVERWGDHLPGRPADLWDWLLEQDTTRLLDLLAVVSAANLNAISGRENGSSSRMKQADLLADAVGLDMTTFWAPEEPFLSRLPKGEIASILREASCPENAAKAVEKAPKAKAVELAQKELAGSGWLPTLFRRPEPQAEALPQAAE